MAEAVTLRASAGALAAIVPVDLAAPAEVLSEAVTTRAITETQQSVGVTAEAATVRADASASAARVPGDAVASTENLTEDAVATEANVPGDAFASSAKVP